jgi:hypothetical protein
MQLDSEATYKFSRERRNRRFLVLGRSIPIENDQQIPLVASANAAYQRHWHFCQLFSQSGTSQMAQGPL